MRALVAVLLVEIACGRGVEPAEHAALAERVDHMQRRLDALEQRAAEAAATPATVTAETPAVAVAVAAMPRPARKEALTIRMGPSGVELDGKAIAADDLDAELKRRAEAGATSRVLIEADDTIAHERMIELIDRVRAAGFDSLAIASRGGKRDDDDAATP